MGQSILQILIPRASVHFGQKPPGIEKSVFLFVRFWATLEVAPALLLKLVAPCSNAMLAVQPVSCKAKEGFRHRADLSRSPNHCNRHCGLATLVLAQLPTLPTHHRDRAARLGMCWPEAKYSPRAPSKVSCAGQTGHNGSKEADVFCVWVCQ